MSNQTKQVIEMEHYEEMRTYGANFFEHEIIENVRKNAVSEHLNITVTVYGSVEDDYFVIDHRIYLAEYYIGDYSHDMIGNGSHKQDLVKGKGWV